MNRDTVIALLLSQGLLTEQGRVMVVIDDCHEEPVRPSLPPMEIVLRELPAEPEGFLRYRNHNATHPTSPRKGRGENRR